MKRVPGKLLVVFLMNIAFVPGWAIPSSERESEFGSELSKETSEDECRQFANEEGVGDTDLKEYLNLCIQDILQYESTHSDSFDSSPGIFRT